MLDDKRKAPCCLMAAWGFALGRMPDQVGHDGRAGDDVGWLAGEVFGDAFDVGVDDGLFAGSALDVLEVGGIVHQLFVLNIMCTTLEAKIRRGIEEYEQGKVHRMEEEIPGHSPVCLSNNGFLRPR